MKKSFDGVIRKPKIVLRSDLKNSKSQGPTLRTQWPVAAAIIFVAILINSVTLLSAFEAHVINVTAKIERRPSQCDALSPGYWRNHEGCSGGAGESIWASPIDVLSSTFSGVFAGYSGAGICAAEWQPNCPSAVTREGRLCRAKLHTLADELNLVAGHLDLNTLIAGADRGGGSFDRLGLSPASTVAEALTAVEAVIARHEADATLDGREWLVDAAQVAERIHSFYEDENPIAPQCIFDLDQVNLSAVEPLGPAASQIEEIEASPVTAVEVVELTATTTAPVVEGATSTPPAVVEETTTTPIVEEVVVVEEAVEETVVEDQPAEIESAPPEPVPEPANE
ncbi:MAG: hypothetical protein HYT46_02615 [Candidatus Vogelbacteria bacterium]|nr:hypothetical protein [Candidatus Vogelbacteria bacterium]